MAHNHKTAEVKSPHSLIPGTLGGPGNVLSPADAWKTRDAALCSEACSLRQDAYESHVQVYRTGRHHTAGQVPRQGEKPT